MEKEQRLGLRTWMEIDKKSIKHNYVVFRSIISSKTKLMGVVKSNAYGHNLFEFALELQKFGIDYLAVDSAIEGIALRREGVKIPILILGYTLPEMIEKAVLNDLEITVSSFEYFKFLRKINNFQEIKIHIKVDTGMHRHGFQEKEILKVLKEIKKLNNRPVHQNGHPALTKVGISEKPTATVVGLYTHFANAKNPAFPQETKKQIEIFNKWRQACSKVGIEPICHACATSGTILYPEAHFDMVRVGIGLYGLWPSNETKNFAKDKINLLSVLSWKTLVGEIKNIKKGEKIGYDFTETVNKNSQIAILPVGYWHGYPRILSSIGRVLINGCFAKVLGRVCMDILIVDITNIKKVKVGDEVTIIGHDGKNEIKAEDIIGSFEGGSTYELITRINPLIKRIYK
jgi:alanine racemase